MIEAAELLRVVAAEESDVFVLRQHGRRVSEAVGLEGQDQVRVATALSDLTREFVQQDVRATVVFSVCQNGANHLIIEFHWNLGTDIEFGVGFDTAQRLMDDVRLARQEHRGTVVLTKQIPASAPGAVEPLNRMRALLSGEPETSPLEVLRAQNQELADALEHLEVRRQDQERLNKELDETNRGVVALYAELNEKSAQLKAASEAKTRFWSNISHELRGPLNSVMGLANLLLAPDSDPLTEEQHQQVRLIRDSGSTLLALVNELLDTAKAESGKLVPYLVAVDLSALFDRLRQTLGSTVTNPEIALVIEPPPFVTPVITDETMLTRILRNLLSNGLKFTERGEVRLSLHTEQDGRCLRFEVTDTGIGIPADQREKVFEEFHQVPGELQTRSAGTGLGLPYARRLAGILGGSLVLDPDRETGTRAVLRVPVAEQRISTLPRLNSILIVDDDPLFRERLAGMLTDFADEIREAADGRRALDIILEDPPDLAFVDLHMPVLTGRELLRILRAKPELAAIPAVLVTSATPEDLDLSVAGLDAGLLLKSQLSAESVVHVAGTAYQSAKEAARETG
ncbi:response regulator [Pseudonocardiaceae bacterium YIM PH 21723]|nr:response regulator [Pseudonocardiaceae bacterium YIM PH 21723]